MERIGTNTTRTLVSTFLTLSLLRTRYALCVLLLLISEIGTRVSKSLDPILLTVGRPRTRYVCLEPLSLLSEVGKEQDWDDAGRHIPNVQLPEKEISSV